FDGPFFLGGRATVYHGSSSGLHADYDWAYWGLADGARAGRSVSTAGDVNGDGYSDIVVGVPGWLPSGRAVVFPGSAAGVSSSIWSEDGQYSGESFGTSVGVAGLVNDDGYSDIIIGAPYNDFGITDRGAVYVYHGSESGVHTEPDWSQTGSSEGELFGTSVGTAGDFNGDGYSDIVVGGSGYSGTGRVYVFYCGRSGPYNDRGWTWTNGETGADVGASAASAGDVNGDGYSDLIVGAPRDDSGVALRDAGAGYVFHGGPEGVGEVSGWSDTGSQLWARFGEAVASAGDLNDDGYDDIMVGLPLYDGGAGSDEGRVLFYRGTASGPPTAPTWTLDGGQAGARFGSALAPIGDVNLDGFGDVAIGAPRWQSSLFSRGGGVFVYFGSGSGLAGHSSAADADWEALAHQNGASFGSSVACAGDVNDDGHTDLLVGAPFWRAEKTDEGGVFLWYGHTITRGHAGDTGDAGWSARSDQSGAHFGRVVAGAGDVNGDGYADVLVSAPDYSNGTDPTGRAFVWYGSHFGLGAGNPSGAAWTAGAEQTGSDFGVSAAGAGDVNGDGYADLILGAPLYAPSPAGALGRVYVHHGSATGPQSTPTQRLDGTQVDSRFGAAIAGAGDVNGDGFADIVVGAPDYDLDLSFTDFGMVYVFHGSVAGVPSTYSERIVQGSMEGHTGASVTVAGDVNADGYADVIFGAPDLALDDAGGYAGMRFGGGLTERARSVGPTQSSSSDSGTIHRLARSESPTSFWIGVDARGSIGRGEVELEWEVKPLGSRFDGTGLLRHTTWLDTTNMVHLAGETSGLASNTLYHWRARVLRRIPTSPFQQRDRWVTKPWGGWNESKLRLWQDSDTDGVIDNWDCAPADWTAWSIPSEAQDLLITSGPEGNLTWSAPSSVGGTVVYYDVLRSTSSSDFSDASATCLESNGTDLVATDSAPPSGSIAYFLVRAENVCGGTMGTNSAGQLITGRDCP
ncbi:MAG: integrin alpha, partial [Acidobacteria bacterium]|nr:integrin alpha [Acidobacteriota bacterium]